MIRDSQWAFFIRRLVITLTFEESQEDEWVPEIDQAFDKAVQILNDNRKPLTFRVTSRFDAATRDFAVEWVCLDKDGLPLPTAKQPKLIIDLQSIAPVLLLGAIRDASQHLHVKSPFWRPLTKNPQIDDDTWKEIEAVNQAILDEQRSFDGIKAGIAKTGTLLPLAPRDLVSVEALPTRIFDMLAKTQVNLFAQLKSDMHALSASVDSLVSNWAYMVRHHWPGA